MRAVTFLLLFAVLFAARAQPDDWMERHRNYCGFAPNDSIDITSDGIPDLVVQGFRSGTDDEPSSSGTCMIHVVNLPGTMLLADRDAQGHWRTKVCALGDTILPLDTTRMDDLYIPPRAYGHGAVRVAYWGYGHQSAMVTIEPELQKQHFVFRTQAQDRTWCGSFSIEPSVSLDAVHIRVGNLVAKDQAFVVR